MYRQRSYTEQNSHAAWNLEEINTYLLSDTYIHFHTNDLVCDCFKYSSYGVCCQLDIKIVDRLPSEAAVFTTKLLAIIFTIKLFSRYGILENLSLIYNM